MALQAAGGLLILRLLLHRRLFLARLEIRQARGRLAAQPYQLLKFQVTLTLMMVMWVVDAVLMGRVVLLGVEHQVLQVVVVHTITH